MKCFVRVTERYNEEANKHVCTNVIARYKAMVEGTKDFTHAKNEVYGFGDYIIKKHRNFRSVLTYKDFSIHGENIRIYLALRVFKRGDTEYERFHRDGTQVRERNTILGLSVINWEAIYNEIESEIVKPRITDPLPELTSEETLFISREHGITQEIFDTPIYESREWVDTVRSEDFDDPFKVAEAIELKIVEITGTQQYGFIEIPYGGKDEKILVYRIKESERRDGWFLLGLGMEDVISSLRDKFEKDYPEEPTFTMLAKKCRRAYPFSMFEDKDFWAGMEKDKNSNFILSDEEIKIVSHPLVFPLFISGRAGSGKSTVLQYLFAEFLLRYLQNDAVRPPVYLSYSANLIENAKKLSISLFDKNHAYAEQMKKFGKSFKSDVEPLLDKTFFVFQQLVRDCIGEKNKDVLIKRFQQCNHVSYTKYRELWMEKFGKEAKAIKEYGPALSWHVIRTYIKGWDSEAYCEPNDYTKIGRGNKSVTDETFKTVFEKVWEGWYETQQEEDGLWDDQDLVRYCLAPDDNSYETCVSERFSAILCDESQDFTRIETDFILRLSVFSNRRIHDINKLRQIPFVFAGDEFQTLNPTGFSWDSLRSYFTERLIHATELGQGIGAPDPISLTRNYRSTEPIVKLGNRIQLLRQTRCSDNSKTIPQMPYYAETHADSVYCLRPDNPLVWKKLGEMGVFLIVPCADGQSIKDYIKGSPINEMIEFYENGAPKHITICNPVQAKGLDYPYVAVYGFDNLQEVQEFSLRNLKAWFGNPEKSFDNETRDIELKYFLSNVYVSATRAKNKLFIISEFTDKSFWAFAFSSGDTKLQNEIDAVEKQMLAKLRNPQDWTAKDGESMLGFIIEGSVDAITGANIVNAGEVAKTAEERGMTLHDAGLMRQAAARYRERGNQDAVSRCEAWAHFFDRNYVAAAEAFESVKEFDDAIMSYWRAFAINSNEEVLNAIAKMKGLSNRLEVRFVVLATGKVSLSDCNRCFIDLLEILDENSKATTSSRNEVEETKKAWQSICVKLFSAIGKTTVSDKTAVEVLITQCRQLQSYGIKLDEGTQAQLAFGTEDYQTAIGIWDGLAQSPKEYHHAKLKSLQYPDNLNHWESSDISDWKYQVVAEYRKHKEVQLNESESRIVGKAIISIGTDSEVREFLPNMLNLSNSLSENHELLSTAMAKDRTIPRELIAALIEARWTDLSKWTKPTKQFMDTKANEMMSMISALKRVKSAEFRKKMDNTFKDSRNRVIDFMDREFKQFNRSFGNQLLFSELGAVMEKRGYFIDAQRYYDWTARQSDEYDFKKSMGIRWIVCKERQAEKESSDEFRQEAIAKRKEYSISLDEVFPIEPKFDHWKTLFTNVLQLSDKALDGFTTVLSPRFDEIAESFPPKTITNAHITPLQHTTIELPIIPTEQPVARISETKAQSGVTIIDKWFDYTVHGYEFRFNPAKFELSISCRNESENLHVKIRNGSLPNDADFMVKDNALVKADGNTTPFVVFITTTVISVLVTESNVRLVFEKPQ